MPSSELMAILEQVLEAFTPESSKIIAYNDDTKLL